MTQEKARKYDDALAKARQEYNTTENVERKQWLEEIFPELAESEDEKNIKNLIDELKCSLRAANCQNEACGGGHEKRIALLEWAIDWLEKQGEEKPVVLDFKAEDWYVSKVDGKIHNIYHSVDKVEPKFKVGDWIISKYMHLVMQILNNDNGFYETVETDGTERYDSYEFIERNFKLWSIEDANDGDILAESKEDVILMFRGIGNTEWNDVIDYHCYYDCYRKNFILQDDVDHWGDIKNNQLKPATKEQRDTLMKAMAEAGYEWDEEKKEPKLLVTNGGDFFESENCEQKTAWSEDETSIGVYSPKAYRMGFADGEAHAKEKMQSSWSEEDETGWTNTMIMIKEVASKHYTKDSIKLVIDWLNSLKERIGG